ncbi:hypothetical protein DVH24_013104, partial [Malus domestica]
QFGFISSDIFSLALFKIPQQCLELEAFALLGFFPITRAERYSLFIFFSPNFFRWCFLGFNYLISQIHYKHMVSGLQEIEDRIRELEVSLVREVLSQRLREG